MAELSNEQIRKNMTRHRNDWYGESLCLSELMQFATDESILGFEDPKSMADKILKDMRALDGTLICEREGCDIEAFYDRSYSTGSVIGSCALDQVCTKRVWEKTQFEPGELDATSIRRASSEQLSFLCAKVACSFNCGYSYVDAGQFGECVNDSLTTSDI